MSNKTQLQTNNTALDALITRVNAAKDVAASLPEAGGTSGDSSIETCTVALLENGIFYYTDENMTLQSAQAPTSITAIKNTIVGVDSDDPHSPFSLILDGYCQEVFWNYRFGCVAVNGDCSITVIPTGSNN